MTAQGRDYLKTINPTGTTSSYITREDRGNTVTNLSGTTAGNAMQSALMKNVETNVVAAGISKSNEYLKGILEALKPGSTTTGSGKLDIKNNTISTDALSNSKINLTPGTVFTASDGKKYKIVRNNEYWGTTDVTPYTRDESKTSKAYGGFIRGAGTGTSDSIPAMLSNGEYVIRAAAVQAIGTPTLDKMNKMAAGGLATKYNIPRMSMGGRVNVSNDGKAPTSNALYNINVTLNGTDLTADDVARTIEQRMRRMQSKQGPSRVIA
jgi:hypothetical protein